MLSNQGDDALNFVSGNAHLFDGGGGLDGLVDGTRDLGHGGGGLVGDFFVRGVQFGASGGNHADIGGGIEGQLGGDGEALVAGLHFDACLVDGTGALAIGAFESAQ